MQRNAFVSANWNSKWTDQSSSRKLLGHDESCRSDKFQPTKPAVITIEKKLNYKVLWICESVKKMKKKTDFKYLPTALCCGVIFKGINSVKMKWNEQETKQKITQIISKTDKKIARTIFFGIITFEFVFMCCSLISSNNNKLHTTKITKTVNTKMHNVKCSFSISVENRT